MGTDLPWAWRSGPAGSSKREQWMQLLAELPSQALVAADAGFVGYEYLRVVVDSGRHLVIRIGSNVRLLRKLGWSRESLGTVYLWPDHAAEKQQPPLVLRLIVVQGPRYPIYLITNAIRSRLTDSRVADIYRRRWDIEVYFRHFKQTFQRRKLRCHCPEHARQEVEWSLLGLWCMALYAQVEQAKHKIDCGQLSIARVLQVFRRIIRDYQHVIQRHCSLSSLLRQALKITM